MHGQPSVGIGWIRDSLARGHGVSERRSSSTSRPRSLPLPSERLRDLRIQARPGWMRVSQHVSTIASTDSRRRPPPTPRGQSQDKHRPSCGRVPASNQVADPGRSRIVLHLNRQVAGLSPPGIGPYANQLSVLHSIDVLELGQQRPCAALLHLVRDQLSTPSDHRQPQRHRFGTIQTHAEQADMTACVSRVARLHP